MQKLAGYADRLSVRPGETIKFHVSNATGQDIKAKAVRVICADANPAGPGIKLEPVNARIASLGRVGAEPAPIGSYAIIPASDVVAGLAAFTAVVTVWVGGATGQAGCILAFGDLGDAGHRVVLSAIRDSDGLCFSASLGQGRDAPVVLTSTAIQPECWYTVILTCDPAAHQATLEWLALAGDAQSTGVGATLPHRIDFRGSGDMRLAGGLPDGRPGTATGCFSGRLERPSLLSVALRPSDFDDAPAGQPTSLVGAWDFAREVSSDMIVDVGPNKLHGRLINSPTRAMTGSNWTGREMNWRHAPEQYGAIHFHADDIDDCGWPVAFEWTVPAGTRSANYALLMEAGDEAENIPFFVCPPKGKPAAKIAVLVSTFTYTVYGNHVRPEWAMDPQWKADWQTQAKAWGAYPHHPGDNLSYGQSTYNYHADGSGISIASWHRPMLNIRIGYITYPYPDIRGSGGRHYQPDTHLTAWLEAKGIAYDIVTDFELHNEGHDLLADYAVVLTGTHPEYHTREMLDALTAYRDGGGRFCYLGGNGFYWKIALHPERPGIVEIRRGEGGIRAWAADPGEYYNQFDGEYGGLWRRNGRPPQLLAGVGFTAQGNFVGSYYRKTAEAADPRVAWMFAGIDGDIIGDFGLSGHGAAGFELDRADKRLGTPANALVVARSEKHPPEAPWVLVPEEQLTHLVTLPGRPVKELIRADMTFFATAGGKGAVFSTGSITFCGSLPSNGFDNSVSRLLENVVRRFLDPAPFRTAAN